MALEPIREILAEPGFRLMPRSTRRRRGGGGVDRGRYSDIRRSHANDCPDRDLPTYRTSPACTCGKKQRELLSAEEQKIRRAYRITHRRRWIMRAIVKLLMGLPELSEFSPPEIAERIGASRSAVQDNLAQLHSRKIFERIEANGGRGRTLLIKINHIALLAFAWRLGMQPTIESWREALREGRGRSARLVAGCDSESAQLMDANASLVADRNRLDSLIPLERNSACVLAIENSERQETRTERQEGRAPPTKAECLAYLRRAKRSRNPEKCRQGLYGAVRKAAWFRGCSYQVSQMHVQCLDEAAAHFGKRHAFEAWVINVVIRFLEQLGSPSPSTRALIRRWQYDAQELVPHWQEEQHHQEAMRGLNRTAARSEEAVYQRAMKQMEQLPLEFQKFAKTAAQTCPTDAPGPIFGQDPASDPASLSIRPPRLCRGREIIR